MSLQTKAFDAQDQLVTLLDAQAGLDGWTVAFGLPAAREEKHLWVDEQVEEWTQGEQSTGIVTKDEAFTLSVFIYVRRTGADAQEIRDEIKAAAGIVASVIGTQPFLGGSVMYASIVSGEYDGAFADAEGRAREGVLNLKIGCLAFLSGA
ncbi:MAG: hypothetical protein Q8M17_10550 [Actinomycetota bacterium]|nr:hypothetical protein [Actinomycetota bacterium]